MKTTNIKTLAAALAAIISVGVLTSCSANTAQTNPEPSETTIATTSQTTTAQPQTTSAKETTTPSSTKPETQTEKTTAPTSATPSTTAPATTATSTTKPATASTTKPAPASTAPASTTAPAPEWTESAVSGTMYVQVAGIYSRSKAVLGAPTVKQYNLNDAVSVTAVTNTGYYKLSDGSFIHADYLGTDKVTVSTTKPSTSSAVPTVSKPAATTKAQSTTTKPASTTKQTTSTTKKPSTTTPSSGSSQSGGDWKGYDMDDPDFPWDEYLKETDGGGSNFNWDDLFGNMTMPWEEEEKEPECVTEWRNMSDAEREEIKSELIDRIGYYLSKEMGCTETPNKGLCNYTCAVAKFDGNDEKAIKYTNYDINKKGNYLIAVGTGEELYGFTNEEIDLCAKNIVEMFASVSLPLWKSYDGYEDFKYFGISVNLQEYSDNLGTHIATGPLYLYISNVNTDN